MTLSDEVALRNEIIRLREELSEMKKHLDLALPQAARTCQIETELEQAKAEIERLRAAPVPRAEADWDL